MKKGGQSSGNADNGMGAIGSRWLAFIFVFAGLLNVTPAIPGWDQLFQAFISRDGAVSIIQRIDPARPSFQSRHGVIRRFPTEWLYPLLFFVMMLVVTLKHSIWRSWRDRPPALRRFGLALDVALIVASGPFP